MAHLDIFSDVACPWCFIGKRRLEQALAKLPTDERPTIRWHAYQLQPDFPAGEAIPARAFLEQKFGGARRFATMFEHVKAVAAAEGIAFDVDRQVVVNTALAHRAVAVAHAHGRQDAAVEAFFRAHFEQGKNLADLDVVVDILTGALAGVAGVERAMLKTQLQQGAGADEVENDRREARMIGIEGVPLFILDERLAVSGAQDPETFRAFLAEAGKTLTRA